MAFSTQFQYAPRPINTLPIPTPSTVNEQPYPVEYLRQVPPPQVQANSGPPGPSSSSATVIKPDGTHTDDASKGLYGSGDLEDGYTLSFANMAEFNKWRSEEEEAKCIEFVKGDVHVSKAVPPRFKEHTKLVCARHTRSGRKKYVKKHPERQRKVPSRKLEGVGCPASISFKTYYNTEEIRASYNPQHSHNIGEANIPFTRRGRRAIVAATQAKKRRESTVTTNGEPNENGGGPGGSNDPMDTSGSTNDEDDQSMDGDDGPLDNSHLPFVSAPEPPPLPPNATLSHDRRAPPPQPLQIAQPVQMAPPASPARPPTQGSMVSPTTPLTNIPSRPRLNARASTTSRIHTPRNHVQSTIPPSQDPSSSQSTGHVPIQQTHPKQLTQSHNQHQHQHPISVPMQQTQTIPPSTSINVAPPMQQQHSTSSMQNYQPMNMQPATGISPQSLVPSQHATPNPSPANLQPPPPPPPPAPPPPVPQQQQQQQQQQQVLPPSMAPPPTSISAAQPPPPLPITVSADPYRWDRIGALFDAVRHSARTTSFAPEDVLALEMIILRLHMQTPVMPMPAQVAQAPQPATMQVQVPMQMQQQQPVLAAAPVSVSMNGAMPHGHSHTMSVPQHTQQIQQQQPMVQMQQVQQQQQQQQPQQQVQHVQHVQQQQYQTHPQPPSQQQQMAQHQVQQVHQLSPSPPTHQPTSSGMHMASSSNMVNGVSSHHHGGHAVASIRR
ncbi:hypothetical protein DL93DRAFT_2070453 [Clavulina sp. PMI_390]|nr:hypothetical protein DL93DRAFT_2070453 [Clavulina sp. PMI_390]